MSGFSLEHLAFEREATFFGLIIDAKNIDRNNCTLLLIASPHSGKHQTLGIAVHNFPEFFMDSEEFKYFRKRLNRTQKQIAELLGTSLKAIHSYEQGWRTVPPAVERQMFFLISRLEENRKGRKPCWLIKKCPLSIRKNVRPGNLRPENCAGLLMGRYVKVKFAIIGKKR